MALTRKTVTSIALDVALVAVLLLAGFAAGRKTQDTTPTGVDKALVPIGRAYAGVILGSYATAWQTAAGDVDAGKPVADALAAVKASWEADRTKQYQATVSPAFAAIVPEATPDESITPAQRAALAAAFRGFAQGLGP